MLGHGELGIKHNAEIANGLGRCDWSIINEQVYITEFQLMVNGAHNKKTPSVFGSTDIKI